MTPEHHTAPSRDTHLHVDLADPLEVARWSWLLDVDGAQLHHAVAMVGTNGDAVTDYIDLFSRPMRRMH